MKFDKKIRETICKNALIRKKTIIIIPKLIMKFCWFEISNLKISIISANILNDKIFSKSMIEYKNGTTKPILNISNIDKERNIN